MTHSLTVGDHGEQVTFLSVVHHHIEVIAFLDEPVHGDDTRVRRCQAMQGDLSPLEVTLSLVEAIASKCLDGAIDGLLWKVVNS